MISNGRSLSQLIRQVASQPAASLKQVAGSGMLENNSASVALGDRGDRGDSDRGVIRRSVKEDDFVGSGLHLSLTLGSGQSITLIIEKSVGGALEDISLQTSAALSVEDKDALTQFLNDLSDSVEALFSGQSRGEGQFDFANMTGVDEVELTIQQDNNSLKQRLEFEKQHTQYGRKTVEGEWSRYNHVTGEQAQHNFALSQHSRDVSGAYGQMDYQWVIDQVRAGMGILGNTHTGDSETQTRVTDFFVSAIHVLFNQTQKGDQLLQQLGASSADSKALIGQTIRALSDSAASASNMPGIKAQQGSDTAHKMNDLADFKADFFSKRQTAGQISAKGEYELSMSVSQMTHTLQGDTQDDTHKMQFRRLLLEHVSQGQKQAYEYNWKHDEILINRFTHGALKSSYSKLLDSQQGILSLPNGRREEVTHFMQRKEYSANDRHTPAMQNGYIKPSRYTEQTHNVNYTV